MSIMSEKSTFSVITHTWNPMVGCLHNCVYCMARKLAKRFAEGASYADQYSRLGSAKGGSSILICDKADLFGDWVPSGSIVDVINAVRDADSSITFLFLTKNPKRYQDFVNIFPENCLLGATIETNRDMGYEKHSKAPKPSERYNAMKNLSFPKKFISIEPMMDFDKNVFLKWIQNISPEECVLGINARHVDLLNPTQNGEEEKQMYCWNCGVTSKAGKSKIIFEVGDRVPVKPLVSYCLKCSAILEPNWMTCYLCKSYGKTFNTGLFMHGGLMHHALCKKCREVVEIIAQEREE